jgi:hypothetical protein
MPSPVIKMATSSPSVSTSRWRLRPLIFLPLFSRRVFAHAQLPVVGAIPAPGQRTVTSVLRVMGRCHDEHFQNDHRVLNRAQWWPLEASPRLLWLLLDAFVPEGPVVMGIDETIERRHGEQNAAKGLDRDPVRSSHAHFVNASGRRWVSLRLLTHIPWAHRVWALPFLARLSTACAMGSGAAGLAGGTVLAADPRADRGGRPDLCRARGGPSCYVCHHPPETRRGTRCACSTMPASTERTPAHKLCPALADGSDV